MALPETILQFGSGRFLRAFFDLFVHHGNEQGQAVGRIAIVQSTGDSRADSLNKQGGKYHVVVRGYEDGQVVDRVESCASVSRGIHAGTQWDEVLKLAVSPDLKVIVSNTTEAGFTLDPEDTPTDPVPKSFPAKLLAVLHARWKAKQPGVTIIPCELIEGNATLLRSLILKMANDWNYDEDFGQYIGNECFFLHTLVDRIVTGTPKEHPLLASDPMVIVAEPFAFFALEDHPKSAFTLQHPAITRARDVTPYFLRKVRILNAAHTALLIKAMPRGFAIVRDAVNDPDLGAWLKKLLFEEIVPTVDSRVEGAKWFAEQTLDRFRNPFIDHKFADIKLHHENKMNVRLVPTRDEFQAMFGKAPPLLNEVITEGFRG
ncbi:tagaturonate reductase [soil metagenome]